MKLTEIILEERFDTLLLDRDGTINVHLVNDYVKNWSDFEFMPGFLDIVPDLTKHFKYIFIVTNQRGIGKGLFTELDLKDIHKHMIDVIQLRGGRIDGIYYSTAISDLDIRRKPNRGMFDDILKDYPDINPSSCLMIGDGDVDMIFARNCGICGMKIDSLKKENGQYYWLNAE